MGDASRRRRGRDAWVKAVAKFERCQLTHEEFCTQERLNLGTFRAWLYRLRSEEAPVSAGFVELEAREQTSAGCLVRFGETEVEFSTQPEPGYLAALLSELGRATR